MNQRIGFLGENLHRKPWSFYHPKKGVSGSNFPIIQCYEWRIKPQFHSLTSHWWFIVSTTRFCCWNHHRWFRPVDIPVVVFLVNPFPSNMKHPPETIVSYGIYTKKMGIYREEFILGAWEFSRMAMENPSFSLFSHRKTSMNDGIHDISPVSVAGRSTGRWSVRCLGCPDPWSHPSETQAPDHRCACLAWWKPGNCPIL